MPDALDQRKYDQGYRSQMEALKNGQTSLAEALHAHRHWPLEGEPSYRGANQATEDYIKELERMIHKARPAPESAEDAASVCIHCHRDIKRVPGGHGSTWVHADTGAVAGTGAERSKS